MNGPIDGSIEGVAQIGKAELRLKLRSWAALSYWVYDRDIPDALRKRIQDNGAGSVLRQLVQFYSEITFREGVGVEIVALNVTCMSDAWDQAQAPRYQTYQEFYRAMTSPERLPDRFSISLGNGLCDQVVDIVERDGLEFDWRENHETGDMEFTYVGE